ncbi:MAG: hypothetical protein ACREEO_08895 [Phenylobacterium sp.]
MTEVSVYQIVRPFAWIAATAFAVGFAGYLAIGHDQSGIAQAPAPAMAAAAAGQAG